MATITYGDGTKINFNGTPTQKDIEEAYSQAKGKSQPVQQPKQSLGSKISNAVQTVGNFVAPISQDAVQAFSGGMASKAADQSNADQFDSQQHLYSAAIHAKKAGDQGTYQKLIARWHDEVSNLDNKPVKVEDILGKLRSNKQIVGDTIQTEMNALSGGSLDAGSLPESMQGIGAVQKFLAGGKYADQSGTMASAAKLGGKVASGAITGLLGGAAGAMSNDQNVVKGSEQGAAMGGAVPLLIGILGGAKNLAGKAVAGTLGLSTGVGAKTIQEAASNPSRELVDAMRGKTDNQDAIQMVKDAAEAVKNQQRNDYLSAMDKATSGNTKIDKQAVKDALLGALSGFKATIGKDGQLDLTSSTISKSSAGELQKAVDEVMGNKDWSVAGTDALKQRLDDSINYSSGQSSKTQAAIKQIAGGVRDQLNQVPGYTNATKPYQETQQFLNQVNKSLSLKPNASQETTAKKILSALRDPSSPIRSQIISQLGEKTGQDITGTIAGANLNQLTPRGMAGPLDTVAGLTGLVTGGVAALPHMAAAATLASPRIVGEGAVKYGQANQIAGKVIPDSVRKLLTKQAIIQLSNQAGKRQ